VGNGPGLEDRTVVLPCLRRIVQISHCITLREDILSYLTDMSERLAQMIQFILTIFFCAGWHQMIVMETTCLQDNRDILLWWICSTVCDCVTV
jgi:hypothetical protein